MPSLVAFLVKNKFRIGTLGELKGHFQTEEECHKKYEEGWLLGKRKSYAYSNGGIVNKNSCEQQPWSFSKWISQTPPGVSKVKSCACVRERECVCVSYYLPRWSLASQGRFVFGKDYELGQKTRTSLDGLSWRMNIPRVAASNQGFCNSDYVVS